MCRVLGYLGVEGLRGDYDERKKAKTRLEKIVKGILPDTRGKKKNTADPRAVQWFYWRELFRLYHVEHFLRKPPGNSRAKVRAASKNFDIAEETIKWLWYLDDDCKPKGQPDPIQQRARLLTGQHFKISEQTVSNLLAL